MMLSAASRRQNLPVTMVRNNLDNIPRHPLPVGYSIRGYQPGDESHWAHIQALADDYNQITPELFVRTFGQDRAVLAARQLYLCDPNGSVAGTVTAWYDNSFAGLPVGQIHWLAIVPDQQGQGLAKPLLAAACRRLKGLGHRQVYLKTATVRIPAINLYLEFGFEPLIDSLDAYQTWHGLQPQLKYPADISSYHSGLGNF